MVRRTDDSVRIGEPLMTSEGEGEWEKGVREGRDASCPKPSTHHVCFTFMDTPLRSVTDAPLRSVTDAPLRSVTDAPLRGGRHHQTGGLTSPERPSSNNKNITLLSQTIIIIIILYYTTFPLIIMYDRY